jgi:hypothetical protein
MKVETPDCNDGEFWKDSLMRVNYMPLYKPATTTSKIQVEPKEAESHVRKREIYLANSSSSSSYFSQSFHQLIICIQTV